MATRFHPKVGIFTRILSPVEKNKMNFLTSFFYFFWAAVHPNSFIKYVHQKSVLSFFLSVDFSSTAAKSREWGREMTMKWRKKELFVDSIFCVLEWRRWWWWQLVKKWSMGDRFYKPWFWVEKCHFSLLFLARFSLPLGYYPCKISKKVGLINKPASKLRQADIFCTVSVRLFGSENALIFPSFSFSGQQTHEVARMQIIYLASQHDNTLTKRAEICFRVARHIGLQRRDTFSIDSLATLMACFTLVLRFSFAWQERVKFLGKKANCFSVLRELKEGMEGGQLSVGSLARKRDAIIYTHTGTHSAFKQGIITCLVEL